MGLVAFSLIGTALTRTFHLPAEGIARIMTVVVLVVGCLAAFGPLFHALHRRAIATFAGVLVLGTVSEVVGLKTGFPFGHYAYTDKWWPTISIGGDFHFPLLLPIAWLLVAGASFLTVSRWMSGAGVIVVGGLLAALVDLVMEPVMVTRLGYWTWTTPGPLPGGAPVSNLLGWFAVATLAGMIFHANGASRTRASGDAFWVLGGHVVLTLGIGLIP